MSPRPHLAHRRRVPWLLVALVATAIAALGVSACGHAAPSPAGRRAKEEPTTLRVLAAASLSEAFPALAKAWAVRHPDVHLDFQFAASSALARQVTDGAPADVLATADEATMQTAVDAGAVGRPVVVARNRPALIVERGNPRGITGVGDLTRPGLVVVVCAPEVPCGKVARAVLDATGTTLQPASLEENVKAVVTKVTLGEADAGIVYATDVRAAGAAATGVSLDAVAPGDPVLEARYPVAVVRGSPHRAAAEAWVEFVAGAEGRGVLRSFGFLDPPP